MPKTQSFLSFEHLPIVNFISYHRNLIPIGQLQNILHMLPREHRSHWIRWINHKQKLSSVGNEGLNVSQIQFEVLISDEFVRSSFNVQAWA
jgi:hypothetical protein